MSNHPNNNQEKNQGNPASVPGKDQKKESFPIKAYRKLREWSVTSKWGRRITRVTALAGVGGACYGCYKLGQKKSVPVTVYIREGVEEEEKKEGIPAEEPAREETAAE